MFDSTLVYKRSLLALAILCCLSGLHHLHAGKNGKGKGGGDGQATPTIKFEVTTFSLPDPLGTAGPANSTGGVINNHLQIAGSYTTSTGEKSAFYYDPQISPDAALDLNLITQNVPEGFVVRLARGINDAGNIAVVCMSDPDLGMWDPANEVLTGVIETNAGFQFNLIPSPPVVYDETHEFAEPKSINNSNDVLIVSQQLENGVLERTTYVAAFDSLTSTWSLDVVEPLTGFRGDNISDRLISGDLFVVGNVADASTRKMLSFPVRVNLTYPGIGEVALTDYSEAGSDFSFYGGSGTANSLGEFLGTQTTTTTTRKGKRTSTSTERSLYKYTDQLLLDASDLQYTSKLNNQLDYFAQLISTGREVLNVDGSSSYIDIVNSIDLASAPTINWDAAETTTEFRTLTDRIDVGSDSDPTNDLPIVFGYAEVIRTQYTAISSKPILLVPVLSN